MEILLEVQPEQRHRIPPPVRVLNTLSTHNAVAEMPAPTSPPLHRSECERCVRSSSRHNESEKRLPKSCLVVLCKYEPALRWTKECDNLLYQTLVEILIPDVLRPIPSECGRPVRGVCIAS